MSDCKHNGNVTLKYDDFVLMCGDCGERIPRGHHRKMRKEEEQRTGTRIRPPRPVDNPSCGPHWDYSGYQVRGGYWGRAADQS
jgi:hypothetical protein